MPRPRAGAPPRARPGPEPPPRAPSLLRPARRPGRSFAAAGCSRLAPRRLFSTCRPLLLSALPSSWGEGLEEGGAASEERQDLGAEDEAPAPPSLVTPAPRTPRGQPLSDADSERARGQPGRGQRQPGSPARGWPPPPPAPGSRTSTSSSRSSESKRGAGPLGARGGRAGQGPGRCLSVGAGGSGGPCTHPPAPEPRRGPQPWLSSCAARGRSVDRSL